MSTEGMGQESIAGLDPWGMKRIEKLLVELDGVDSIKIVPDGHGGIDEIHVLSSAPMDPKRVVRNIESALLAEFGLQIDHRKISVARKRRPEISHGQQTMEQMAESAAEFPAPQTAAASAPRMELKDVKMERQAGREFSCKVELARGEEEFTGEAEGPDFERSRIEVAATAVLEALLQAAGDDVRLGLQGVSVMESLGRSFVIVVVGVSVGRQAATLSGIETVNDSVEEAAVLASLKATNRWLESRC
ncbi:MAG: hypothetical protein E4H28_04830 [Gemmatimonadales bacterium]|nr:MAG: hypothetical protein E4H28_04830 [Gemmatimonadales bacterium]